MAAKVFISSTSRDLRDYREATIEVCNRLQLIPIAMEFFVAMGKGATEGSKQKVDKADLYVGIFAHRYGYIEEGYDKAVTEIEFDYAGDKGLDRLCFLVDPTYPWPPDAIDYKNHEKLQDFKSRIDESLMRAQFTDVNDFKAKLMQALIEWKQHNLPGDQMSEHEPDLETPSPASAPPLPWLLIGREDDIQRLKERLGITGKDKRKAVTVMHGWPGVGKTTLVTALAYDDEVKAAFPDGILWASVGEYPNLFHALTEWGRALGADMSQAKTLDDAMAQVRALLRDKRALLIVDNIWDADAATPFKLGGPNCVTLITTRFLDVARRVSATPDEIYKLGTLSNEDGFELLEQLAPTVTSQYQDQSLELVTDLEGLPLALRVAGRLLEAEARDGFDVSESFRALRESHRLLKAKAPDDRFDPQTGTTPTVSLLLKKSTDRLDEHTRDCFAFLGAFAAKPATFDMAAMKAVWMVEDPKPIVRKLVDRGLLEPIQSLGRFWMHAVLVMHAESLLEEDEE